MLWHNLFQNEILALVKKTFNAKFPLMAIGAICFQELEFLFRMVLNRTGIRGLMQKVSVHLKQVIELRKEKSEVSKGCFFNSFLCTVSYNYNL